MRITVKLGSTLRVKAPDFRGGEGTVDVSEDGPRAVSDVMASLNITPGEVNLIYRNHVLVQPSAVLRDGDRVALFPPNFIHFSQFYLQRTSE